MSDKARKIGKFLFSKEYLRPYTLIRPYFQNKFSKNTSGLNGENTVNKNFVAHFFLFITHNV